MSNPIPFTVAIDFDGTLVENKFPEIGAPRKIVVDVVRELQSRGARIILWTCRNGQHLEDAKHCCKHVLNLHFDAINDNLPEVQAMYGDNTRKVSADLYLDDRNTDILGLINLPFMLESLNA